ncbi:hypothetical protein G6N76_11185 [Rhizobium daejeonense]|uniref:Uncharacterized protein n=1 Tax=Rhizobium daejeonense TaxID=240521 RepID=A0A6M1S1U8_9HYPH|nr:hypothetical protein [Rhizobium daejeonense]NGO64241.1 hypothetical protein [Rhizobium daejeonense]
MQDDHPIPLGKSVGSARSQFIASVRKALRSVEQGRAASAAISDIRQAIAVLDRKTASPKGGKA